MNTFTLLLNSRKVQIAVFVVAAKAIAFYAPHFPPELLNSIQELAMVLIAAIAAEDVAAKLKR